MFFFFWYCAYTAGIRYERLMIVCYCFVDSAGFRRRIGHGQQAEPAGKGVVRLFVERVGYQNGNGHGVVVEQLPVQAGLREHGRRGLDDRHHHARWPTAVERAEDRRRDTVGRPGPGRPALRHRGRLPGLAKWRRALAATPTVVQRHRHGRLRGSAQLRQIQQQQQQHHHLHRKFCFDHLLYVNRYHGLFVEKGDPRDRRVKLTTPSPRLCLSIYP